MPFLPTLCVFENVEYGQNMWSRFVCIIRMLLFTRRERIGNACTTEYSQDQFSRWVQVRTPPIHFLLALHLSVTTIFKAFLWVFILKTN